MYSKQIFQYTFLKRVFDYIFALLLTPFFLLILVVISIFIVIDSPGNVLFIQDRVGFNSNIFKCFKFRTMYTGTPNISTAEMQVSQISAVTRVGFWLRKTSLDELPQLINILLGQMSFIGPRPALPSQEAVLKMRQISGVDQLLPGITGLAQVRGRDELSDEEKVKFDTEYLHNLGFWNDLQVLIKTFSAVISAKGNR